MKPSTPLKNAIPTFGFFIFSGLISPWTQGQVISPQAQELRFSYTATFTAPHRLQSDEELVQEHALYLFGALQSPELAKEYKINRVEGIGTVRSQQKQSAIQRFVQPDGTVVIEYKNSGLMLLHHKAAQKSLYQGYLELVMPYDLNRIYDPKCTDPHYTSLDDYWYFWNPYRKQCTHLADEPIGQKIKIEVKKAYERTLDSNPRFDLLRGPNGNGDWFRVDIVFGFNDSSSKRKDEGRLGFAELKNFLLKKGFKKNEDATISISPAISQHPNKYVRFHKELVLDSGKRIAVEINTLLTETQILSEDTSFALFFKEAVQNADVFIYAGHSGLGGNLDIEALEAKAGNKFVFNSEKRQIFLLESCASYSYYLEPFRERKSRAKLDVITNGLSSYYEDGAKVIKAFLNDLLDPSTHQRDWKSLLKDLEKPLGGYSYMINVGGV